MSDQSSLDDFGTESDSKSDLYECEICGRAFDSSKGRGIHRANSHSEQEIKQVLITELQRLAEELGKSPGLRDMTQHGAHSAKTYQKKFGSWNEALREANLEINEEQDISKSDLRNELIRLADELGRTPTSRDMAANGKYATSNYSNKFGSWNEAVREAGLEPTRERNVPKDHLLSELKRLTEELGHSPTVNQMRQRGRFGVSTYSNEFGSWNNALQEADLELNKQNKMAESELLDEIRKLSEEVDEVPSANIMRQSGDFAVNTYKRVFGSWNDALRKAGLDVNNRSDIPDAELLYEVQRLSNEIGRTPTAADMEQEGQFGWTTYRTAFGSWNNALQEAGFKPNVRSDIPESELLEELQRIKTELGHVPERRDMDKHGQFDSTTYMTSFGTWNNALRKAGFAPNKRLDIPESELLAELQRLADELDRTPIRDEMEHQGNFSSSVYTTRFGSWNEAVIEAGLNPNKILDPSHLEHIVRSTWELKIADLLLDAGVNYEYESLEVEYGDNRIYTPDFVTNEYVIEVKGVIYGSEKKKAKVARSQLENREYVVVGAQLPADIHIPWNDREKIKDLFT